MSHYFTINDIEQDNFAMPIPLPGTDFVKKPINITHHCEKFAKFEGYLSRFDVVDRQKDCIRPGAFSHTLKQWHKLGRYPPLIWQHHLDQPIGIWRSMIEDNKGLWVHGELALETQKGSEAWILMKNQCLGGLSIGYRTVISRRDPHSGVRHIFQIDLIEGSVVTLPANDATTFVLNV